MGSGHSWGYMEYHHLLWGQEAGNSWAGDVERGNSMLRAPWSFCPVPLLGYMSCVWRFPSTPRSSQAEAPGEPYLLADFYGLMQPLPNSLDTALVGLDVERAAGSCLLQADCVFPQGLYPGLAHALHFLAEGIKLLLQHLQVGVGRITLLPASGRS